MNNRMRKRANGTAARLFIIVGNDSSGKDELIRGVNDLGKFHAQVVYKYTNRPKKDDDGDEIICNCKFLSGYEEGNGKIVQWEREEGDEQKLTFCDITYERNGNQYGFASSQIWNGLKERKFQMISVSEIETINLLRAKFGRLVVLLYVHSSVRTENFDDLKMFSDNFNKFDHVLVYEGKKEDLLDQIFRLFRAYE